MNIINVRNLRYIIRLMKTNQLGNYFAFSHLSVSFGAERSGLEEREPVVDAPPVHVVSGLDVVQGICDAVELLEKVVVEGALRFGPDLRV